MNPPTECGNCGLRQPKIPLHNVRLRGIFRKLCTHCVLRLHPPSFCPFCFSLHDPTPPPHPKRIVCSKCSSFTHSHCATSPQSPFLCPPCADHSFSFFNIPENGVIDKKLASVLVCAAKIAALSMAKAVVVARAEAERRVKEAAICRKKAREALQNVGVRERSIKVENSVVVVNGINNSSNNNGLLLLNGNVVNNGSSTTKQ